MGNCVKDVGETGAGELEGTSIAAGVVETGSKKVGGGRVDGT
jgi:hypothetical protein